MDSAPNSLIAQPAADGAAASHLGRVLVAEDTEINQQLAMSQLEQLGYECVIAENGLVAAQAVAEGAFDAVLMDWHMPEANGLEATRMIRQAEAATSHVPIIAVTAAAGSRDRESCLRAGMDDFLSKPVSIEDLRITLSYWISARAESSDYRA